MCSLSIALIHYPVYDKNRIVVTTAVTNYDIHDIARVARTYEIEHYFIVSPLESQRKLAQRIIDHWTKGFGAKYNPKRKEALFNVKVAAEMDDIKETLKKHYKKELLLVATDARVLNNSISYEKLAIKLREGKEHYLLVLGTGWGLTEEFINLCDLVLEPVLGKTYYNHLSVRCAAAIMIDRLMGK